MFSAEPRRSRFKVQQMALPILPGTDNARQRWDVLGDAGSESA